jgi:hypothetical protein
MAAVYLIVGVFFLVANAIIVVSVLACAQTMPTRTGKSAGYMGVDRRIHNRRLLHHSWHTNGVNTQSCANLAGARLTQSD